MLQKLEGSVSDGVVDLEKVRSGVNSSLRTVAT
jgi:hypothetical protein